MTHPTVQVFGVYPINPNMLSLYAFLNATEKKQEVGSLALEHCTAIAAK